MAVHCQRQGLLDYHAVLFIPGGTSTTTDVTMSVDINTITIAQCKADYAGTIGDAIGDGHLCLKEAGKDTCYVSM